jgi:hypothetical protein
MTDDDAKKAYLREKHARLQAESKLETLSWEIYKQSKVLAALREEIRRIRQEEHNHHL